MALTHKIQQNKIQQSDKTLFSFELLPPLKGNSINEIYETIDYLKEFRPPYINITYHQAETVYKKLANGLLEPKVIRKRPGTVAIAAAIKNKYPDIDVVPHLICGGFTKEETEDALIDLHFLGIKNVMLIRGDANVGNKRFVPKENGHKYALGLVKQVQNLKNGIYLDQDLKNPVPLDFNIRVAGYPEKHIESPNKQSDLYFLKQKVKAGATSIVTQMFFDNQKYFDFVKDCRDYGIDVPIIPGIKPVSVINHLNILPKTFNVDLPEALVKEIIKCKDNDCVRQVGIEWAIQQSKELKQHNVPSIHYYTMGNPDNIYQIAKEVF